MTGTSVGQITLPEQYILPVVIGWREPTALYLQVNLGSTEDSSSGMTCSPRTSLCCIYVAVVESRNICLGAEKWQNRCLVKNPPHPYGEAFHSRPFVDGRIRKEEDIIDDRGYCFLLSPRVQRAIAFQPLCGRRSIFWHCSLLFN